jgi:hypothetical protein
VALSCPIRTDLYGGLPSTGGFSRTREYGIGLAEAFEAAHCLLGSLGKNLGENRDDWLYMLDVEEGHLREELGIIQKVMKEYARPVYRKQMTDFSQYKPEWQEKVREASNRQVEEIREAAPRLISLAKSKARSVLDNAKEHEVPVEWLNAAGAIYLFVIDLAEASLKAVADWPSHLGNPYKDPDALRSLALVEKHLDRLHKWGAVQRASRTASGRWCDSHHSFAWITPDGKVIRLKTLSHYEWAVGYVSDHADLRRGWERFDGIPRYQDTFLISLGWIRVANAVNLSASPSAPPAAWKAASDLQLECLRDGRLTPDSTVYLDLLGRRSDELTVGDFARKYVSRTQEDDVFETAMARTASMLKGRTASFAEDRDRILEWVDSHTKGGKVRLYREVIAPSGRLKTNKLGIYWTPEKEKAHSPFGRLDSARGEPVVIEALVSRDDVDEVGTVAAMRRHPGEREIRLLPGARVEIVSPSEYSGRGKAAARVAARYLEARSYTSDSADSVARGIEKAAERWWSTPAAKAAWREETEGPHRRFDSMPFEEWRLLYEGYDDSKILTVGNSKDQIGVEVAKRGPAEFQEYVLDFVRTYAPRRGWFVKTDDSTFGAYQISLEARRGDRIPDDEIPRRLYHVTPYSNAVKILRKGLLPRKPGEVGRQDQVVVRRYPERIYLATSHSAAVQILGALYEHRMLSTRDISDVYYGNFAEPEPWVIFEVDTGKLRPGTKFYRDPDFSTGGVYTLTPIPRSAVKLQPDSAREMKEWERQIAEWEAEDPFARMAARGKTASDDASCFQSVSTAWIDPRGRLLALDTSRQESHDSFAYEWALDNGVLEEGQIDFPYLERAREAMMRQGWVKVSNPWVYEARNPSPRALRRAAEFTAGCIAGFRRFDPEKTVALYGSSGTFDDLPAPDFIDKYGPPGLSEKVFSALLGKVAKTFKVDVGQPIWYGKYKNKRGIIKEFKSNDKGDAIIVVEQIPNPTGRKQPKEMKLFKIRPRKEEKRAAAVSGRIRDAIAESMENLPDRVRWDMERFAKVEKLPNGKWRGGGIRDIPDVTGEPHLLRGILQDDTARLVKAAFGHADAEEPSDLTYKWFPHANMISLRDENDESRGYLRVVEELPLPELLDIAKCPDELTRLFEGHGPAPVWKGWMTEVDYGLRNRGLGLGMYEAAIAELKRKHPGGFYFVPSHCGKAGEGTTTGAAKRVWRSLARKYPSEGLCLWIPGGAKRAKRSDIEGWSDYFVERDFDSPEEARSALRRALERSYTWLNRTDAERDNFAAGFPIYSEGRKVKLGIPPELEEETFDWKSVNIRPNTLEELETAGYVNAFDSPRLSRVKWVTPTSLTPTERGKNPRKVERMKKRLLIGEFDPFLALVVEDGFVVDGHHRLEMAKQLGLKTVPVQEVSYRSRSADGSREPRPSKVARRYAARPIRLDRAAVQKTRDKLVDGLRRWVLRHRTEVEALGVEQRRPLASAEITLDDVAGRPLTAEVHLLSKRDPSNPLSIVGAGAGKNRRTGRPTVIVFLNAKDNARWFFQKGSVFPDYLFRTLLHELTHVADTFDAEKPRDYEGGTKKLMAPGQPEVEWDDYYNDPMEVRAFMREIYEQVRENFPKFVEAFGETTGLRYALKSTDWSDIKEHLTPRNKKIILKGVYTALQDDGLISGGSAARVASRYRLAGKFDWVDCTRPFSLGWIDPKGKLHNLKGEIHEQWALKLLERRGGIVPTDEWERINFDASDYLLNEGWVKVTSPRELQWAGTRTPYEAFETMAELAVHCILKHDIHPERVKMNVWHTADPMGSRKSEQKETMSAPDFIRQYGGPRLEDQLFAALLAVA